MQQSLNILRLKMDDTSTVWWKYALMVFYVVLTTVGVLGNFAVCVIVYKTRSMRTTTNVYLVSLAISDTIFFMSALPAEIYDLFGVDQFLGVLGCALRAFLPYLAMNTSSLNIVAFSVERFIAICYPMKSRYLCTVHRAIVVVTGVWLFSVVYNSPWLALTNTRQLTNNMTICSFRLDRTHVLYKLMYGIDCVVFYILPIILYIFIYARIYLALRQRPLPKHSQMSSPRQKQSGNPATAINRSPLHEHNRLSLPEHGSPRSLISINDNHVQNNNLTSPTESHPLKLNIVKQQSPSSQSRQIVTMLGVVTTLFAILWLPYKTWVLHDAFFSRQWSKTAYFTFAKVLVFINSAINPLVYNAMSSKFRKAFSHLLCHDWKRVESLPTEYSEYRFDRGGTTGTADTDTLSRKAVLSRRESENVHKISRPYDVHFKQNVATIV